MIIDKRIYNKIMIQAAVIGTGGYAFEVIKRIWDVPDVYNIKAVASMPGVRSNGLVHCIKRNIPVYYDVAQMLSELNGSVDIVFVPTSIHSHYSLARQCLQAGYNVCVEKPPVVLIQHYDDLLDILAVKGKMAAIGFQYLYSPLVQKIKADLCASKYGEIRRVRSFGAWIRYDSYYQATQWGGKMTFGGEWVLDGSISNPLAHMLASSLYFACDEELKMATPVSVQAELYRAHRIEGEDTSSIRVITDRGVEVVCNATVCPEEESEVETVVECDFADIYYTDFDHCRVEWKNGKVEDFVEPCEQRVFMLESIAECLANRKPFKADLLNCRAFTLTINCAYESSQGVHTIDDYFVERLPYNDTIKTVISSIDEEIRAAHRQGMLFSETGSSWAHSTKPFECAGYGSFPMSKLIKKSSQLNLIEKAVCKI